MEGGTAVRTVWLWALGNVRPHCVTWGKSGDL